MREQLVLVLTYRETTYKMRKNTSHGFKGFLPHSSLHTPVVQGALPTHPLPSMPWLVFADSASHQLIRAADVVTAWLVPT